MARRTAGRIRAGARGPVRAGGAVGLLRLDLPIAKNDQSHHTDASNGMDRDRAAVPAFVLSIPEAADVPSRYVIRRHAEGGGRKDILALGEPDSASPYLVVEIYRPGSEIGRFAGPQAAIAATAAALGPVALRSTEEPLVSK